MKIRHVILTLVSILLCLTFLAIIFPKDGVSIGSLHLTFPSLKEVFSNSTPEYANIDNIVQQTNVVDNKTNKEQSSTQKDIVTFLYPNGDSTLLYSFFKHLEKSKQNKVRMLHYGDSQIEGDRITSYIRTRLQESFGGVGQGEIPLFSLSNIQGVSYKYSSNWHHKSILNKREKNFNNFGIMMTCCIPYTEMIVDSTNMDTTYIQSAWIELNFSQPVSNNLHLYCSSPKTFSKINISSKGTTLVKQNINQSENLVDILIPISQPIHSLRIETTGTIQLYSIDNSSDNGVYVDNISLRGSSGWGINYNNPELITKMANLLDVKLIIMQFGVNAIPQEEDKVMESYDFFRKEYSRQLAFLKKAIPDAEIIVIGASDRSRKKGSGYETNPNIPKLIQAQKKAAEENDCIFWNLFEAMGGNNSMPSWVLREEPLANPDFIHFNSKGAKHVAEMFYQALDVEYQKYLLFKQQR
ncbi:MAG: hypothetical protein IJ213_01975 [Bacteroidales bacterium]|nr:hypothetical protein [Bacteroidales bacterium]